MKMQFKRIPGYARNGHKWFVFREIENAYYFYGAYNDPDKANAVAAILSGDVTVFDSEDLREELELDWD